MYSTQGAKGSESTALGTVEAKAKYDFINIPIMAKYYVVDGLAIEAGPYVGFLMKAENELSGGSLTGSQDIKDNMNSVDFGLGLGASYSLSNGFFGGARYNLGLTDLPKENDGDAIKNGVIQVSVGYKF